MKLAEGNSNYLSLPFILQYGSKNPLYDNVNFLDSNLIYQTSIMMTRIVESLHVDTSLIIFSRFDLNSQFRVFSAL